MQDLDHSVSHAVVNLFPGKLIQCICTAVQFLNFPAVVYLFPLPPHPHPSFFFGTVKEHRSDPSSKVNLSFLCLLAQRKWFWTMTTIWHKPGCNLGLGGWCIASLQLTSLQVHAWSWWAISSLVSNPNSATSCRGKYPTIQENWLFRFFFPDNQTQCSLNVSLLWYPELLGTMFVPWCLHPSSSCVAERSFRPRPR